LFVLLSWRAKGQAANKDIFDESLSLSTRDR